MLKSDVKAHFGTLEAIAAAIDITKSAVSQWPDIVPEGSAYKLQFITGGVLRVDPAMYGKIAKKKSGAAATEHSSPKSGVPA